MNKFIKIALGVFLITTFFMGFVADRFETDNKKLRAELGQTNALLQRLDNSHISLVSELDAEKQLCGGISRSKVESYELNQTTLEVGLTLCRKDKVALQRKYNKLAKESKVNHAE